MIRATNYVHYYCFRAETTLKNFVLRHQRAAETLALNVSLLPVVAAVALSAITSAKLPFVAGICWEKNLRIDVAGAARQRILKELTKLDEFSELIGEIEPALVHALNKAFMEISQLEATARFDRSAFNQQQEAVLQLIEKDVWQTLEPKIQDTQKKARLRAWMDQLESKLSGVDNIQQRAADLLRETTREILYDFNGKAEETLGQSIPGEIEGTGEDHAMHILAETIVEKIMDRELDFEVAMRQVVAEVMKEGVIDAAGQENLVRELLTASRSNNGTTLAQLFDSFRRDYLDPGPGKLQLPKKASAAPAQQVLGKIQLVKKTAGRTDGSSN
ncbi:MAG: hypothetical protein WCW67_07705 [Candidatus Margulisiibacteriota bacterium]|jgi:predicted transcriptional regulator YheO